MANVESLLETYAPIPFAPAGFIAHGGPVDEADLCDYKIELNDLYNDLTTMKNTELRKRESVLKKGQNQILLAKKRVQEMIEHMTEVGQEIARHKEKLRDIEDEINAFKASTAISGSPGASAVLKKLLKEESEEKSAIVFVEKHLNGTLARELADEESKVIQYEATALKVKKQIEDYKTINIARKEKEIEDTN